MATLSSRASVQDDSTLEVLQELVFVAQDVLGLDEDIPDELEGVLEVLDHGVTDLATGYVELQEACASMGTDLLVAQVSNARLAVELTRSALVLEALALPPIDEDIIDNTLALLKREGEAELGFATDDSDETGLVMSTLVKFDEDKLREALKTAIMYYNNELGNKLLGG
jgi:hypothetical protein